MTQKSKDKKIALRREFLQKRALLSSERRREATKNLLQALPTTGSILSFCSFSTEIDLLPINSLLASQKRLLLPRIEGNTLVPYRVSSLDHLLPSLHLAYKMEEPDPATCCKSPLDAIDLIFVPAVAFDADGYRLGLGKGYYDRFLSSCAIPTWGIGFLEQLSPDPLPKDPWDIPVQKVVLL